MRVVQREALCSSPQGPIHAHGTQCDNPHRITQHTEGPMTAVALTFTSTSCHTHDVFCGGATSPCSLPIPPEHLALQLPHATNCCAPLLEPLHLEGLSSLDRGLAALRSVVA